jgi:hypothetical protein
MHYTFDTDNGALKELHDAALAGLAANVVRVAGYDRSVLIEGAEYQGIWLECGPLEGACYGVIRPSVAIDNHRIFFKLQHDDGYLPCFIRRGEFGTAQIQTVVPIAATAFEVYQRTGDREFLEEAYDACIKWEAWLVRHRDTRGTGLCEVFCEWDTGHDNSPRLSDVPHGCPDGDASKCPATRNLPWIAPDLSATLFGGRIALANMAEALGRNFEAGKWRLVYAEKVRRGILAHCYNPEDACFYDLDATNKWVRVRGDALTRVLSEHVVDQPLFDTIFERQIGNPAAFWTEYPLPSIAADDPAFVKSLPWNSWGGAAQGLTALRAPRWLPHYGKHAAMTHMTRQWLTALTRDTAFYQQMNPFTGDFIHAKGAGGTYSPTMLVMIEYTARLYGVMWTPTGIEWNVRVPDGATVARHEVASPAGMLVIENALSGATLTIDGREIGIVGGPCRIVTSHDGQLQRIVGTEGVPVEVSLTGFGATGTGTLPLAPDEVKVLASGR